MLGRNLTVAIFLGGSPPRQERALDNLLNTVIFQFFMVCCLYCFVVGEVVFINTH